MNPDNNPNNNNNNQKERLRLRPTKGISDAVQLMKESLGDPFKKSKQIAKQIQRERQQQARLNQQNNGNPQQRVFQNQSTNLIISQRVVEASQSHQRIIQLIDKVSQGTSTQPKQMNLFNNTQQTTQQGPSVQQGNFFNKNQQNTQAQQKVPTQSSVQSVQQKKQQTNIFGQKIPAPATNIFGKSQPTNSLFGNSNNTNTTFVSKPQQNNTQKPVINPFAEKPQEQAVKQTVGGGLFSSSAQVEPQKNIFGNKVQAPQKKQTPLISHQNVFSNSTTTQQEKPQEEIKPQPENFVRIFSEGVFQEDNKKPKPVLIFNNYSSVQKESEKNQKPSVTKSQPPVNLLFNNNGAVVQNVKPKVDIFDLGKPIKQDTQPEVKPVLFSQNVNSSKPVFQAPKMQIQTPVTNNMIFNNQLQQSQKQQPKPSLFSNNQPMNTITPQNPAPGLFSNSNSNQPTSLFNKPSPTQSLFSNNNQNKSLFSVKQQSVSSQFTVPKPSVFQNNNSSNLFSKPQVSQKQQKPQGIFGRKQEKASVQQPPVKQEKVQAKNIFASQGGNNIFSKKTQPENKPTPTGGLFGNNQSTNIFSQPQQQNSLFGQSNNNTKVQNKQQNSSQGKSVFQQTLKSSNMFGKSSKEDNIFKQPVQSQNMFKQQQSQTPLFGSQQNSASLFSSQQSDSQIRGAALFSQKQVKEEQQASDGQDEGEREDDDGLVHSNMDEVQNGEMKYEEYLKTTEFVKVEALKFKIVRADSQLLEKMKLSIEQFQGDNNIYIIVRTPNKIPKLYGILHAGSQLKKMKDTDSQVSISIKKLIQIDLLNQNKKSLQQWRVMFHKSEASTKFVKQIEKIIQNKKNQQSN